MLEKLSDPSALVMLFLQEAVEGAFVKFGAEVKRRLTQT
jgi:hypothetical protein